MHESKAARVGPFRDESVEVGLEERSIPRTERRHAGRIDLDTDHIVPEAGKTGCGHETGVAGADDGDLHETSRRGAEPGHSRQAPDAIRFRSSGRGNPPIHLKNPRKSPTALGSVPDA
jgi:hypothetical protein